MGVPSAFIGLLSRSMTHRQTSVVVHLCQLQTQYASLISWRPDLLWNVITYLLAQCGGNCRSARCCCHGCCCCCCCSGCHRCCCCCRRCGCCHRGCHRCCCRRRRWCCCRGCHRCCCYCCCLSSWLSWVLLLLSLLSLWLS